MEVAVKELRNNLSRYLDRVRNGEEVVVTDRGRAIARVLPVGTERALDRLIAEGIVTPARRPRRPAGDPIRAKGAVSDLSASNGVDRVLRHGGARPLLVAEAGSARAAALWDEADRVVSARLVYPEGRAALARGRRLGRLTGRQLRAAVEDLDARYEELDIVEVDDELARRAGRLAELHSLRGHDAVRLAAPDRNRDPIS